MIFSKKLARFTVHEKVVDGCDALFVWAQNNPAI